MTHQAAALQNYNDEIIKVLDDLYSRREDLNHHIRQDEEDERLQQDSQVLSGKLRRTNESMSQKLAARAAIDRTIAETEAAYDMVCSCLTPMTVCAKDFSLFTIGTFSLRL
uniref:Sjogren syndrome nuclear autoantigen 1 n=1 Tax=Takifugu rubripes TaxID=31033 RepID=H2TNI3_TAKRU